MTDERIEVVARHLWEHVAVRAGLVRGAFWEWLSEDRQRPWLKDAKSLLAALDAYDREHPKPFEDVMEAAKRWLEKVYPPDVPLVCDRDSPDPGPRLAAALRDCLEAQDVGAADSVAATDKKSDPSDRDDAPSLRAAVRKALDLMAQATDSELGEGGVARRAYAVLYSAYFRSSPGPSDRDLLRALVFVGQEVIGRSDNPQDLVDKGLLFKRSRWGEDLLFLTKTAREAIRAAINQGDG